MLVGHEEQLALMQKIFGKLTSSIVVLYGDRGMGKTALAREFMKEKDSFYYSVIPAAAEEARLFMANSVYGPSELNAYLTGYEDIFVGLTKDNKVKKVIVIDEFASLARNDQDFMDSLIRMVKNQADYGRVMVILTCSSISYIEENKSRLFKSVQNMTTYIKLEELSFMDTMHFCANYPIEDCVRFYGLTGGVPQYILRFNRKQTFVENVIKGVLSRYSYMHQEGHEHIREELRETALYNTILGCLANGMNKINDIYNYTGFGRDKISVYLKNLMDRDIVEKVFSYDVTGKDLIKKGSYRIKPGFLAFWYRYLYANQTELVELEPEAFFEKFVKEDMDAFFEEAFIQVCSEYLQLLEEHDGLKLKTVRTSRVYEKDGRIDIIREDGQGVCAVAMCDFSANPVEEKTLLALQENAKKSKVNAAFYFIFARSGFHEELQKISKKNDNVVLVDIKDL